MGTGKSYRAAWLSRATGWDHLRSDQVRKELAGLAPGERRYEDFGQGIYNDKFTRATYRALAQRAEANLAQGLSVIVDASFQRDRWREEFVALARRHGAQVLLVEVAAGRAVVQERLRRREAQGDDASDGRVALMDSQAALWQDTGRWAEHGLLVRLDGAREADESMGPVMSWLRKRGYADER
jgi:predicted kinase